MNALRMNDVALIFLPTCGLSPVFRDTPVIRSSERIASRELVKLLDGSSVRKEVSHWMHSKVDMNGYYHLLAVIKARCY
jgi:hypothetical protein